MGDPDGNGKGDFLIIDEGSLQIKGLLYDFSTISQFASKQIKSEVTGISDQNILSGTWVKGKSAKFGYDFWYQPYHDVLISSEWGAPRSFKCGCIAEHVFDPGRC